MLNKNQLIFVVEITRRAWGYEYKEIREFSTLTGLIDFSKWLDSRLYKEYYKCYRNIDKTDAICYECEVDYFIENASLKKFFEGVGNEADYRMPLYEGLDGTCCYLETAEVINVIAKFFEYTVWEKRILEGAQLTF